MTHPSFATRWNLDALEDAYRRWRQDPDSVDERTRQLTQVASEAGEIVPDSGRYLSMSVGEAFYPADGSNAEDLLATADRRMYKNKQQQKLQRTGAPEILTESKLAVVAVQ